MANQEQDLVQHVRTINACNQRGGRMLSMIDLIDANTVDIHLAAYLSSMMQLKHSLIVGAKPGAAGKTAIMCACLNFIPRNMAIQVMDNYAAVPETDKQADTVCYLAHEIGAGSFYAYVWGQRAREFFKLQCLRYMIVSNMHADTLGQMHKQLCEYNHIPRELVDSVTLKVFLKMRRSSQGKVHRWISHVYENNGVEDILIWLGKDDGLFIRAEDSLYVKESRERMWRQFLLSCQKRNIRKIEDVRRVQLRFLR